MKHPHIITHLFADGGRILKSIKTSYAQFLSEPNMAEIVRTMMKEQHKAMILEVKRGNFAPPAERATEDLSLDEIVLTYLAARPGKIVDTAGNQLGRKRVESLWLKYQLHK